MWHTTSSARLWGKLTSRLSRGKGKKGLIVFHVVGVNVFSSALAVPRWLQLKRESARLPCWTHPR